MPSQRTPFTSTDLSNHQWGTDDTVAGTDFSINFAIGDAGGNITDHALGGNDTFTGGLNSSNTAYGDATAMAGHAQGGDDKLTGGDVTVPTAAGTFDSVLVGDAKTMSEHAHGGNDTLISGTGNDDMWGDAVTLASTARGGNDTFVFKAGNGHDRIEDFGQGLPGSNLGRDHIDVAALGVHTLSALNIGAVHNTDGTYDSTITFSVANDVVVHSKAALSAHDFWFA